MAAWTSRPRSIKVGKKPRLVHDLHPKALGLGQLAASLLASQQMGGLGRNTPGHGRAKFTKTRLGVLPAQGGEGSGDDHDGVGQSLGPRVLRTNGPEINAHLGKVRQNRRPPLLVQPSPQELGGDFAEVRQRFKINSSRPEHLVVIVKMLGQRPSRNNAHLRDPQARQHTSQPLASGLINGLNQ